MYIIGLIISLAIGVILGLVGGGGSILTVPLVHYVFGEPMLLATTYSLFVVALSAAFGSVQRIKNKEVDFQKAFVFVVPSMLTAVAVRMWVMPLIPVDFELFTLSLHRATIITILLIVVMVYTALRTLLNKKPPKVDGVSTITIVLFGILTGLLSGFIGAGGGFIIVPILLSMGLDMKKAVATSMFIIAVQSGIALIGDFFNPEILEMGINWELLLSITGVTILGVFLGNQFQKKVSTSWLKKAFSILLLAVAIGLLLKL
ncbi:MAG TPA: sulfite exporter TauE/SafE family protein [Crocinitomicaceae bacterium]|nr:sulfite exporter TauE/SafE family protein [Crocinitomicaceae bacterium]